MYCEDFSFGFFSSSVGNLILFFLNNLGLILTFISHKYRCLNFSMMDMSKATCHKRHFGGLSLTFFALALIFLRHKLIDFILQVLIQIVVRFYIKFSTCITIKFLQMCFLVTWLLIALSKAIRRSN